MLWTPATTRVLTETATGVRIELRRWRGEFEVSEDECSDKLATQRADEMVCEGFSVVEAEPVVPAI